MSHNKKAPFRGKQILLLGLVALVITAGYYRWTVETDRYHSVPVTSETLPSGESQENREQNADQLKKTDGENQSGGAGLAQLRQERDSGRSEAVEQWEKALKNNEASAETKQELEKKVKEAAHAAEKEKTIETLVKAKGFEDCFAHVDASGVTVRVKGGEVNGSKVAQIKDIVVEATDVSVRDIKISAE